MSHLTLKNLHARLKRLAPDAASRGRSRGRGRGRGKARGGPVTKRMKRLRELSMHAFVSGGSPAAPRFGPFTAIVAFKPTGWTVAPPPSDGSSGWRENRSAREPVPTRAGVMLTCVRRGNVTVYNVPYSEHSSFGELRECVQFLDPLRIIPTVNCRSRADSDRINSQLRLPLDALLPE